jgi:hypothetical protein
MSSFDHLPADDVTLAAVTSSMDDLAVRRPGQGVSEKAEELRQAEPFRSAVRRVLGVTAGDGTYRKGGKGEMLVAKRLAKLGAEWRVLHSIPVGDKGTDIDHVAIGPGGVFSLNTKNHSGQRVWVHTHAFKVNGSPHNDYLRASRAEASKASRLLSAASGSPVEVTGVIVVIADRLDVRGMPLDTPIVGRKTIVGWLRSQPVRLSRLQIESIYAVARQRGTWR